MSISGFGLKVLVLFCLIYPLSAMGLVKKNPVPGKDPDVTYRYPVIPVPFLKQPPQVDGVVDKAEWTQALQSAPLIDSETAISVEDPAVFSIGYTDDAIYVAFRVNRPAYAGKPKAQTDPKLIWEDDCFEFFFRPKFGTVGKYRFTINSQGLRNQGIRTSSTKQMDIAWEGKARLTKDGWEGEAKIPFKSMEVSVPKPGEAWEFQGVLSNRTPQPMFAVSLFIKDYGSIEDMAYLVFEGKETPTVRTLSAGELNQKHVGLFLEMIGKETPAKVSILAELYKPNGDKQDYFRILETEANPYGAQVESKERDQVSATEASRKTLSRYTLLKKWQETLEIPSAQARRVDFALPVPPGTYVLHYRVTDSATGGLLAGDTIPFKKMSEFTVQVEPYLLIARVLSITCDYRRIPEIARDSQIRATLREPGTDRVVENKVLPVDPDKRRSQLNLSVADRLGKTFDVSVQIVSSAGKVLADHAVKNYILPKPPVWLNNAVGKIEALGAVPAPWTPMVVEGESVKVWGRTVTFDKQLMPVQITHHEVPMTGEPKSEQSMLANPARLQLEAGSPVQYEPAQTRIEKPWILVREMALRGDDVTGKLTLEMEFDGLMKYTLDLEPAKGKSGTIRKLAFEVPIARSVGTYYNLGYKGTDPQNISGYTYGAVPEKGLVSRFTEKVWIGNDTVGLDWVCENDRYWTPLDNVQAVRVEVTSGQTVLKVAMVDGEKTIDKPVRYQWAILPTPAKAMNQKLNHELYLTQSGFSFDPKTKDLLPDIKDMMVNLVKDANVNALNIFPYGYDDPKNETNTTVWNPDFGQPGFNPAVPGNDLRQRLMAKAATIAHEAGIKWLLLYTMWGGPPTTWPGVDPFWREMSLHPLEQSFGGYLFEPTPVFNDWYVWTLKDLIQKTGIDGIYQDSAAHARFSTNLFTGTGWYDDKGKIRGSYPVFGNRELFKRIWVLFHQELKKDALIYSHNSHFHCPVVESFVDVHHAGEGSELNRDFMIPKWYGYPMGNPTTWTRWNNPLYRETRMASWRLGNLLDIDLKTATGFVLTSENAENKFGREKMFQGYSQNSEVAWPLWKLWQQYPWSGSIWLPPWKVSKIINTGNDDLLASLHYNPGKMAIINVSSFIAKPMSADVAVDFKAIGFDPANTVITDVVTEEKIKIDGDKIRLNIEPNLWRMVKVQPK